MKKIADYLSTISDPLNGHAPQGFVRVKCGHEDVESAGVKIEVVIALIEIIRETINTSTITPILRNSAA